MYFLQCLQRLPEPIEVILDPTPSLTHPQPSQATPHLSHPPQLSTGVPLSSSSTEYPTVPSHPDVIDLGRGFHLGNSLICQMKWGDLKLAVYIKSKGEYYMGLYQVISTFVCGDPLPCRPECYVCMCRPFTRKEGTRYSPQGVLGGRNICLGGKCALLPLKINHPLPRCMRICSKCTSLV